MAYAHTMLMMRQLPYLRVAAQGLELHLRGRTTAEAREGMRVIPVLRDSNELPYARLSVKPLLGCLNWTSRWYRPKPRETEQNREHIAAEVASFGVNAFLA